MEAHRGSSGEHHAGARLIDGAILLLAFAVVASIAIVVAARTQQGGGGGGGQAGEVAPAQQEVAGAIASSGRGHGWRRVWQDEFKERACPSPAKWRFEHGFVRNGEQQWYQPQNAFCKHGALVLEARRQQVPNPRYQPGSTDWRTSRRVADYTSASITSRYSFTYGRAEALIRIDPRSGSWPAFWTIGAAFGKNQNAWPGSGEVDIMEYYRDTVLANVCIPKASWCGWSSTRQPLGGLGGSQWADRFHLWAMDWNARWINLYLDGRLVHRFRVTDAAVGGRSNPYIDRPSFLLLSQAIGGFHGGNPANTQFPVRLEVKYVRVYQRTNQLRQPNQ